MKFKFALGALAVLTLIALALAGAPLAQAQSACVETYTVVAGDTLGAVAEKYLGDIKAYPQIVTATNEAAKTDTSFKTIADANVIEVGQKLCIPAKSATTTTPAANTTTTANPTPSATATPSAPPLNLAQLGNATYSVQDAPGGDVVLKEGKAEEEIAPGSASKYTAQVSEPLANGALDGKAYAAAILITSGGGSGTFYNIAVVPNNNGTPGTGLTGLLGDRIKVSSVAFQNNFVQVNYLDRKADEPMSAEPTVALTKFFQVSGTGALVEAQPGAAAPTTTPTAVPGSLEGTYIMSRPGADVSAVLSQLFLGPNSNASWLDNYVGRGTSNATGVWAQTSTTTVAVTLIKQDGRNVKLDFTFDIQGDKLVATKYDQSLYGESGITFYKADVNLTGQVTYLPKIALPDDAVVEVYLLDVSKADAPGTYISGYSATTHGDQVPLSFTLPYDSLQINPSGMYVVQAFISTNGKLLFKNANGVAVITAGAPNENVQVVVDQVTP